MILEYYKKSYYKKSFELFIFWTVFYISYNYYFGFNLRPQSYLELFFDFLSYVQLGIFFAQFLHDYERSTIDKYTKIEEILLKILAIKESKKNG